MKREEREENSRQDKRSEEKREDSGIKEHQATNLMMMKEIGKISHYEI